MKKYVFIVEDQLKDLDGFFLCLNDLLLETCDMDTGEQVNLEGLNLFFLHICWSGDASSDRDAIFKEKIDIVKRHVKEKINTDAFVPEYCPVLLDDKNYTSKTSENCANELYNKIQEHMDKPTAPNTNPPHYVVLMDVILNNDPKKDYKWIQGEKDTLSSCLYRLLPKQQCIVYSEYPPAPICEKWSKVARLSGEIIERELITRSRAIYVPFETRLYQALRLKFDEC